MADYKRKRVNRLRSAPKPKYSKQKTKINNEIAMTSSSRKVYSDTPNDGGMKVVKGKKLERQRKTRVFTVVVAAITVIIIILNMLLPIGITEATQNLIALIGSGRYPINLVGGEVLSVSGKGAYYYVLTDTNLNAISSGGKEIYTYTHGFDNPIVKTSKTRALVFAQGGNTAFIYNLAEAKGSITTDFEIITADISDSGVYAIATHSDSYASEVYVYGKNNSLIYKWSSSDGTVNNISISPNGKKIAVSLFKATSGEYNSKINILNFESATPEYTENFDGAYVYDIKNISSSAFSVVLPNSLQFINWSEHKKTEYKNDYSVSSFKNDPGGCVAVFNRSSDISDNKIAFFTKKGELKGEFSFKGVITDITAYNGNIYCLSGTDIYLLSNTGKILRTEECGFGVVKIIILGTNQIAAITDNRIDEIKLKEEKE